MHTVLGVLTGSLLGVGATGAYAADTAGQPTLQQMWQMIQSQQAEIRALKQQLNATRRDVAATDRKVEATADQVELVAAAGTGGAPAASRTHVGGYGELHYNDLGSKSEIDFHRFVLFLSHEFSDSIRFFSELEVEHAVSGDAQAGAVELEQAYIEMDLNDRHRVWAGLNLLPIGLINETHEPTTFYGVERNPVEKDIIPTTWWEAGLGVAGEVAPGWRYDLVFSSGLNIPASKTFRIRDGRQKVAKAVANDGAFTGRLRFTGLQGVELGTSLHYETDVTQGSAAIGATLFEAHIDANRGPFGLRALYANWQLEDGGPAGPAATGRDEQIGWYIEPSYRFQAPAGLPGEAGVFVRYNEWDNNAGNAGGGASEKAQTNIGVNWWPHEDVVFKLDFQNQDKSIDDDGFNLGVGYQF